MFKKVLLFGFMSLFQRNFAASQKIDPGMLFDFIHSSRDSSIRDYKNMHDILYKLSWKEVYVLTNYTKDACELTPLHDAAMQQNFAAAYFLIRHGAKTYIQNSLGKTPFVYGHEEDAIFWNFFTYQLRSYPERCVDFDYTELQDIVNQWAQLLEKDITNKVISVDWDTVYYPVRYLANERYDGYLANESYDGKSFKKLLSNFYYPSGESLLYKAIINGHFGWVLWLLKYQVDISVMMKDSQVTYQQVIENKIKNHFQNHVNQETCIECYFAQQMLLLLQIHEKCFAKYIWY